MLDRPGSLRLELASEVVGPHRQRCKEQSKLLRWESKELDLFMHSKGQLDILVFQGTQIHMLEELESERQWATEDLHIPVEHRQVLADTRIPSAMEGESTAKDTEGTVEPLRDLGRRGPTGMQGQARARPRPTRCGLQ